MARMQADQAATDAFDTQLNALKAVQNAAPFPSQQNLDAIRAEAQKAKSVADEAKQMFPPFKKFKPFTDQEFKRYIDTSLDEMQSSAKRYGVELPLNYYFTFGALNKLMEFDPAFTPLWVQQMEEVKNLVRILIEARVNQIVQIRRVAISDDENQSTPYDFMNGLEIITNKSVIRVPFELTFNCFSGELAGVLDGFAKSASCVLIKNLQVEPSGIEAVPFAEATAEAPILGRTPEPAPSTDFESHAPPKSAEQRFFERYGMRRRPTTAPPPPPPKAVVAPKAQPQAKPVTVLTESPLRVTLFVEVIKLEPKPEPAAAGAKGGAKASRGAKPAGATN